MRVWPAGKTHYAATNKHLVLGINVMYCRQLRSRQFRGLFTNDMEFSYTGMGSMRDQFSPKIHREHVQKLREYEELLSFSSTHHSHSVSAIEQRSVAVFSKNCSNFFPRPFQRL